jgi:replication factor C subunit 2/4
VVRTKVKRFAKLAPSGAADSVSGASGASTSMPSFKLVILDEADAMTEDAQNALRRMMETYAPTTRFCLICNYVSRIIEPLASRCAKFRFSPVPIPLMVQRMQRILAAETDATQSATQGTTQGALDETLLTQLAELTEGDMRRAIMYVQNAVRLRLDAVTMDTFLELAGYVPQHQIATLYAAMRQGDHDAVRTHLIQLVDREGYTGASIVSQLHAVLVPTSVTVATTPVIVATTPAPALGTVDHTVVETPMDVDRPPISDAVLAECCLVLGATSRALADGADELVQLLAAATKCMELFSTKSV